MNHSCNNMPNWKVVDKYFILCAYMYKTINLIKNICKLFTIKKLLSKLS